MLAFSLPKKEVKMTEDSVKEVIARSKNPSAKIVAGGPLFTTGYDEFDGVAGTNTHHAETWPNTPYIDVVV